jgi:hypothetical protein
MIKKLAAAALGAVLAMATQGTPALAAPKLKAPKVDILSSVQTFFPDANYYLVDTTLRWKAVKGADVYLVCGAWNGAPLGCHTGIHTTTYTYSVSGIPAGATLSYYVQACDTVTGPAEVCVRSQDVSLTVGG